MGKPTAKNDTGSGGDERGMHERKCKPPGIPSKASSNTSLVKRLGESENSSRSKPVGSSGTRPQTAGRSGSNLRSPVKKEGLGQPANRVSSRLSIINKEAKKSAEASKTKSQIPKMKQESESKQRASSEAQESSPDLIKPGKEANYEQATDDSKNGLNGAEVTSEASTTENGAKANGKSEQNGDGSSSVEREEDFKLRLEAEEPNVQLTTQEASTDLSKDNNVASESKTPSDEATEETQTDADSNSVVVESTTSELSEATESTAPSEIKDGEAEEGNSEAVSYDSSKLQKNCSITLTNCMEDPQETGDSSQELSSQGSKKSTLSDIRKVSGRRSLSRLRNEPGSQGSPNCSLQVNTSYDSERTIFQSPLRPTQISNGRTLDEERKRKIAIEVRNDMKKLRAEVESCASDYKKSLSQTQSTEVNDCEGSEKRVYRSWCSIM